MREGMKKVMRAAGVLVGGILLILFAAPIPLFGIFNSGNAAGLVFSALVVLYSLFYPQINPRIVGVWKKRSGRVLLCTAAALMVLVLLCTLCVGIGMLVAAGRRPQGTETVVVLGCQVRADGPSRMLQERIDAAYAYLTAHDRAVCILSGGQGADEPMSEAECMRQALIARGIAPYRLIIEDKSTSTRENLEFSKVIIEERSLNPKVAIVTNNFHMLRAGQIAGELDMQYTAVPAKTTLVLLPTYAVREVFGVLYELFL